MCKVKCGMDMQNDEVVNMHNHVIAAGGVA